MGKVYPQTPRISFDVFGLEQGISNNYSRTLMEDSQGFIWVGTTDGLNRFDGYSFQTFRHDPDDSLSLSGNYISKIYEDSYGYIWVGTHRDGLNRFDPKTGTFLRFDLDTLNAPVQYHRFILSIYQDSRKRMWVGTGNGIHCLENYDPQNPLLTGWRAFERDMENMALVGGTEDMIEEETGLWMANWFGLKYYDFEKDKFFLFSLGIPGEAKDKHSIINKIIRRKDNELWLATKEVGMMQVKTWFEDGVPKVETQFIYEPFPVDPNEVKLSSGYILDAVFMGEDDLWLGTGNGLDHLNLKEQRITYYKRDDQSGLSANAAFDMLLDHQGNLWLATEYGVNLWGKASKPFVSMNQKDGLVARGVNGFYKENSSTLWIGTSMGLNRYTRNTGEITTYMTEKNHDVDGVNTFITDIHPGPENQLWIVCYDSLRLFDTKTGRYEAYRPPGETYRQMGQLRKDFYYSMIDEAGDIWLGGVGNVYRFHPQTRKFDMFEDVLERTSIVSLVIDQYGTFWLGTGRGLFIFDIKNESAFPFAGFDDYPSPFTEQDILDIMESHNGILWIGTEAGLYSIDMKNSVIRHYSKSHGLPNEYIKSLEEDEDGNIWIGTNKGLCKFDPETETFTNYTQADGLCWDEMQFRGSWKSPEGEMFFGSLNGFSSFFPNDIQANPFPPKVQFSGFSILNEPVPVGAPDSSNRNHQFFLEHEINHTKEIHLTYQHRVFSFEFAALNYLQPQKNQYAYMLEGFDDEWIYTNIRKATYTNIDPGEYTFKVKGSNNDGIWSEENAELKIIIHPPWWKTWWAYGLYVFLITVAVWWIFRMRMESLKREMKTKARIEQAKMDEREKVRARSSRDFHDEAGNKLTKISLYTGLLRNKATSDHEMMDFVNGIETNLKELSSGMRDFIWVLDPKHDSLSDTLMRIKEFGDGLFEHSGTEFTYMNKIPESFQLNLDLNTRRNLLMIFKEGMNNALKYANAHEVRMIAELKEDKIVISLIDDGMGFDRTNLGRVNGLNNMKTRASESGGELIFDASPGIGTAISFVKEIHPKG